MRNKFFFFLFLFILVTILLTYLKDSQIPITKSIDDSISSSSRSVINSAKSTENFSSFSSGISSIKILLLGDNMLAQSIGTRISEGEDFYQNFHSVFSQYDLIIANLETNVSNPNTGKPVKAGGWNFNTNSSALLQMKSAGINVISLANNHTNDYGKKAFSEMLELLKQNNIEYFGGGHNLIESFTPAILNIRNFHICLWGFNDIEKKYANTSSKVAGTAYLDKNLIKISLDTYQEQCNFKIAYPHWGQELTTKSNTKQIEYAHFMIDSGFDLVVGSHPHVVQDTEEYKGKKIYYSIGNFIMEVAPNTISSKAIILNIEITNKGIINYKEIPITIKNGIPSL